ncbi:hypothetical protein [Rhizobium ruizarguesonis]|uniref:hypothetical protein n=1 Tax=Rhizobium ruizarguesonis TaxID=2081791 RepID=UPI0037231A26
MANAGIEDDPDLPPLTRKQKDGELLYRTPELVIELKALLQKSRSALATSKTDLSSAALVYIMRNLRPNRDERWYSELWVELIARTKTIARKQASGLSRQKAGDVADAVCDWLRELVFSESDKADVLEAFFFSSVYRQTINEIRKVKVRSSVEHNETDLEIGDRPARDWIDAVNNRNAGHSMPRAEAAARVSLVMAKLTEREREAVTAVYVEGLRQKSSDPEEMTAAKKLNVSHRRVGELLANARKRASGDEEEK